MHRTLIRADYVQPGDKVRAPEGGSFYEIATKTYSQGFSRVTLSTGWGSITLDHDERVEVQRG